MENKNEQKIFMETMTLLCLKEVREVMGYNCKYTEECDDCILNHGGMCIALMIDNILENSKNGD